MKENDGDAGKVPIKCIKSKMAQIQRYSNTIISLGSCTILVIRPVADKTLKTIVSTSLNWTGKPNEVPVFQVTPAQ